MVMVYGPAYLDRVLRVDGPLRESAIAPPLDQSVRGDWRFVRDHTLHVSDDSGLELEVLLPDDWPGPFGQVRLQSRIYLGAGGPRVIKGLGWSDDLGGMGAGFAAALQGSLVCPLGAQDDPTTRAIESLLAQNEIPFEAVRRFDVPSDWTLLVTSGAHGDKLAIGVRECLTALAPHAFDHALGSPCELRVVAGLPNPVARHVLAAPGARCRLFAPAMRNIVDRDHPLSGFASAVDLLCCNRQEWEALADREEAAWRVSILVITDGPSGASARFTQPDGETGAIKVPAFPRDLPPRDTNRAGEAFASTLVATLLDRGWDPALGVVHEALLRLAMLRASAAAALVLDQMAFGFPGSGEVDSALNLGRCSERTPA
jgi:ribokinase